MNTEMPPVKPPVKPSERPGPLSEPSSGLPPVLGDIQRSPTPYHAVQRSIELLDGAGFTAVDPTQPLPAGPGGRYLARGGTLVAWWQPETVRGYLLVGAHTDSPNLRVRTRPDTTSGGFAMVGMEVYGGALLNSWLDRDLGLAGRVAVAATGAAGAGAGGAAGEIEHVLYCDDDPILRIPQLAIHLDREIRTAGLLLDSQNHLVPLWATGDGNEGDLRAHVAAGLGVQPDRILAWDLMAFDTQAPAVVGRDRDLYASARIDNLVSSFCGLRALIDATTGDDGAGAGADGGGTTSDELPRTPVLALFDHEEIGSQTATGAAGSFLADVVERISAAAGASRAEHLAAMASSLVISADGAHATHPNYVDRHEPSHHIGLNQGPVIKRNANQRYATDATSEAFVVAACTNAEVPLQYYIHRNDLPCGSTIGPITAARLGVATVDLGAPQLAMHSAREMAGLADLDHLQRALLACWQRA